MEHGKVDLLRKQIRELEIEKTNARNLKVRELLQTSKVELTISDEKQRKLISVLLRNGYIDEDYLDFVSLFYEGSITKTDFQFLINVKSQVRTAYNYKLQKVEKLIGKISSLEFDKQYTLNYTLLDHVLLYESNIQVRDSMLSKLADESAESIEFFDGFIEITPNIATFVKLWVQRWPGIWNFLEGKSNFTEERKNKYFKWIVEFAEVEQLAKLYKTNLFRKKLLHDKAFLSIITDENKLKNIIRESGIKFTGLDLSNSPRPLIDYIYEGDFFQINLHMLKSLLTAREDFNEDDFNKRNYFALSNSKSDKLMAYVDLNINEYIENVYLKLDENHHEEEEQYIQLLNDPDLTIETKSKLIDSVVTIVSHIELIADIEVMTQLISKLKVAANWDNGFYFYEQSENNLTDPLIHFLESNAAVLSNSKIAKDVEGERKYTDFMLSIIKTESFSNEMYDLLLRSVPYIFTSIDMGGLPRQKVALLVAHKKILFTKVNFDLLKSNHADLHIRFLEENKSKFLQSIAEFEIDDADISKLLRSEMITSEEKNKLIETVDEGLIAVNRGSVQTIGHLVLKNTAFRVSNAMLKQMLTNDLLSVEQRVRIHNWKFNQLESGYYDTLLISLGEPYSDIAIKGKRPLLPNNEYNRKFIEILESIRYISTYSSDAKGIRVITFRNNNEGQDKGDD
jgi:hypothetical protein